MDVFVWSTASESTDQMSQTVRRFWHLNASVVNCLPEILFLPFPSKYLSMSSFHSNCVIFFSVILRIYGSKEENKPSNEKQLKFLFSLYSVFSWISIEWFAFTLETGGKKCSYWWEFLILPILTHCTYLLKNEWLKHNQNAIQQNLVKFLI